MVAVTIRVHHVEEVRALYVDLLVSSSTRASAGPSEWSSYATM